MMALPPDRARAASRLAQASDVLVHTWTGALRGIQRDEIDIFTGIPFGASTAGLDRFKPPRPLPKWSGVFDATHTANVAPQATSMLFPLLPGVASEDCLQLNVWAPHRPGPHPVLVWLHGGSNVEGSCAEPDFDCSAFARDGLVAVSFNYRLGALGFLEVGGLLGAEYRGSANNGLRDQMLALQWVQHNIAAFGGDPAQVTVAGESAGAFDLCALLACPAAKGLMKRAIVASGGQAVQDVEAAKAFAEVFASRLGGSDRLLTAPFEDIVAAQAKTAEQWPHALPFRGMIDLGLMPQLPVDAIAAGRARDVELLIGWCRDETRLMVPEGVASNPAFAPPTNWLQPAQLAVVMTQYSQAFPGLTRAELIWKLTTAEAFSITSARIADAHAGSGGQVLVYELQYTVPGGPFGSMTPHGFDVPMVFDKLDSRLARLFGMSLADKPMQRVLQAVWSSFSRTGNVDAGIPAWPPYDLDARKVMILDQRSHVDCDPHSKERNIWSKTVAGSSESPVTIP